ncbi:RNA-directed DNA polymerase, eukaryota, partial [Tanacetum coccineum]
MDKHASVESKLHSSVSNSFRRMVRGGIEQHMLVDLHTMLESVSLSNSNDRWVFDLVSDGSFRVKETRNFIDDTFLPAQEVATRWVNFVPIKVNVFFWRVRLDCLPTRVNLVRRGINVESYVCPMCSSDAEDINHILFRCELSQQ